MTDEVQKSQIANGSYTTKANVLAKALISIGMFHSLWIGWAGGILTSIIVRPYSGWVSSALALITVVWLVAIGLIALRYRGVLKELQTVAEARYVARGDILRTVLSEAEFQRLALALDRAESEALAKTRHLKRIEQGHGFYGWRYRKRERQALSELRAAFHQEDVEFTAQERLWRGISLVGNTPGQRPTDVGSAALGPTPEV